MFDSIYQFNYVYDKEKLLTEAQCQDNYQPYYDPKNNNVLPYWHIKHIKSGYGMEITKRFESLLNCSIKPRFYHLFAGFELPMHIDRGTQCSINFVLNDSNDPVMFENKTVNYKQAVLDVTKKHGVLKNTTDRYLFKMSIFHKSFDEICKIMHQHNLQYEFDQME